MQQRGWTPEEASRSDISRQMPTADPVAIHSDPVLDRQREPLHSCVLKFIDSGLDGHGLGTYPGGPRMGLKSIRGHNFGAEEKAE